MLPCWPHSLVPLANLEGQSEQNEKARAWSCPVLMLNRSSSSCLEGSHFIHPYTIDWSDSDRSVKISRLQ